MNITYSTKWERVDWSQNNVVIARRLGVARTTVAFHRERLGKKPVKAGAKWDGVDWTKPDMNIALQLGVTRSSVTRKRKELGKPQSASEPARRKFDPFGRRRGK